MRAKRKDEEPGTTLAKHQQLSGQELEGREKLMSESEEVAWGSERSYVERSNEEGRSTSTVVARMRDRGAYAGWPNGLEVAQRTGLVTANRRWAMRLLIRDGGDEQEGGVGVDVDKKNQEGTSEAGIWKIGLQVEISWWYDGTPDQGHTSIGSGSGSSSNNPRPSGPLGVNFEGGLAGVEALQSALSGPSRSRPASIRCVCMDGSGSIHRILTSRQDCLLLVKAAAPT
ncbi:hypothetical protein G7046_g1639 [Stylonectria norvegica]|nr:hypothetical protein G7046_g1639 [Stylonectria norvegica]